MGKEPPESETKTEGLTSKLGQWAGFGEKKLWDFLELLIVPAVLAFGAFYLEEQASNRQEQIATARCQQETLAKYFDQITQLLLEKKLRQPGSDAQVIARARTLSTLGELDEKRQGLLLKFLYEANLISQNKLNKPIVSLDDANLSGTNLRGANLSGANLNGTDLSGASLNGTDLSGASLSFATLKGAYLLSTFLNGADLNFATLSDANLSFAILKGANLSDADLRRANLRRANLSETNLSETNLRHADLRDANLSHANLSVAELSDANLRRANLSHANLSGALLRRTNMGDANLSHTNLNKTYFSEVSNLTVDQVKLAKNWKFAIYEPSFRQQLGLPLEKPVSFGKNNSTP